MAHFAQINEDNIVIDIMKISDDYDEETDGQAYIKNICMIPGRWLKTSYNTNGGEHRFGGTPFRGNYAMMGGTYDPIRDVFLDKKPYPSMVLDEETLKWEYPVPLPDMIIPPPEKILTNIPGRVIAKACNYIWDEKIINWKLECVERIIDVPLD